MKGEGIKANKVVIFDIMDSLRVEFNNLIVKHNINYRDAMMGAHNFHKLAVQRATEPMESDPKARAYLYRTWQMTFNDAMDVLIDSELKK